jgi:hypothetical protein
MALLLIFILKLVGWLLLAVLCLVLLLVALVLFLPVPYHLRLVADEGKPPAFTVRVFGFQLYPKRKKAAEKPEPEPDIAVQQKQDPAVQEDNENENTNKNNTQNSVKDNTKNSAGSQAEKTGKKPEKKKGSARQTLKNIHRELTDAGNRRALSHVWKELAYLLGHFGPRKVKGELSFSLGDPASTGYATAALSLCPFVYSGCGIYPDFAAEKPYVLGQIDVKGHVRLIHALHSGLGLLLDKDIRKIFHKVRN